MKVNLAQRRFFHWVASIKTGKTPYGLAAEIHQVAPDTWFDVSVPGLGQPIYPVFTHATFAGEPPKVVKLRTAQVGEGLGLNGKACLMVGSLICLEVLCRQTPDANLTGNCSIYLCASEKTIALALADHQAYLDCQEERNRFAAEAVAHLQTMGFDSNGAVQIIHDAGPTLAVRAVRWANWAHQCLMEMHRENADTVLSNALLNALSKPMHDRRAMLKPIVELGIRAPHFQNPVALHKMLAGARRALMVFPGSANQPKQ